MFAIHDLTFQYKSGAGVRNITLTAGSEVVAVIGPNGSGKTTLFECITGDLKYTSGEILLEDKPLDRETRLRNMGYLPEVVNLNPRFKAGDFLRMISDYKFRGNCHEYAREMMEAYEIDRYASYPISKISMGTLKKLSIIAAFMGSPSLIVLDEPTNALDTHGVILLKDQIAKAGAEGSTVLLSSHVLDFAGSVADRAVFLKDGEIRHIADKGCNWEETYKELYME